MLRAITFTVSLLTALAAAQPSITPTNQERWVFLRAVAEGVPGFPPIVREQYAEAPDNLPFSADLTASAAGYMNHVIIRGVQQSNIFENIDPESATLMEFSGQLSTYTWSDSGSGTGEFGQFMCEISFDVHPFSVVFVRTSANRPGPGLLQWFSVALYGESPTVPLHELVYANEPAWSTYGWWEIDPGNYTLRVFGLLWPNAWMNSQADFSFAVSASVHVNPDVPGDLNCDGYVNNFDIDAFVLDMIDMELYADTYGDCFPWKGDLNHDGEVNAFDIDPFVDLIVGAPGA